MKKFLFATALAFGLVVSQIVVGSQAEAADYYLGNWEGGWKAYLMTETQRGSYSDSKITCTIKTVSPKGAVKYIDYSFSFSGDRVTFNDSLGASGVFYINNPGDYQIENKAVGILIGDASISPSSNQREVYVGMNDYGDGKVYVLTDTIRDITFKGNSGFSVKVKLIRDDGTQQVYSPWYFFRIYDQWCMSTGLNDYQIPTPVEGILLKVAETANQYR